MKSNRNKERFNLYYIFLEDRKQTRLSQRQARRMRAALEKSCGKNFRKYKTKSRTNRSYKYNNKKEV